MNRVFAHLHPRTSILTLVLATHAACQSPVAEDQPEPAEIEVHTGALGEGFASQAIGMPSPSGSWMESGGIHTVLVGGSDIWNTADQFRFVYETLTGDGTITARVDSLTNTNNFAKAGVMMRETLDAGARNVFALVTPVASNGFRLQARTAAGGTTSTPAKAGSAAGTGWVRLARTGSTFTASYSANGGTWTQLGTVSVSMGSTIYLGLAATSHANGTFTTARFSNVTSSSAAPTMPPPQPTGLGAVAGDRQVRLGWTAAPGAASYTVYTRPTVSDFFTEVARGVTSPSYTHTGLTNGIAYRYAVSAQNAVGTSAHSAEVEATPFASPFRSEDIGNVGRAGSWTASGGTHTVKGAGGDIYGTADAYHFVYQSVTGDVTVTARVQSLQKTNAWAKAGVFIRENVTPGSRYAATLLSPTASNKFRLQRRTATGGSTSSTASSANSALPSWVRLVRTGSTFRAYHSSNGSTWTAIGGGVTVAIGPTALVGFGATSHVAGTLATAVFTDVTVAPHCTTAGATRCSGQFAETCKSGFWQVSQACPYVCSGGACTGECVPGSTECLDVFYLRTCSATGTWQTQSRCPFACSEGACTGVCRPGSRQCSGDAVQTCSQQGQWEPPAPACQIGCDGGRCKECYPGERRCTSGATSQTCTEGFWGPEISCAYSCGEDGGCTTAIRANPYRLDFGYPNGEETRVLTLTNQDSIVPMELKTELEPTTGPGAFYMRRASSCLELEGNVLQPGASCTFAFAGYFDEGAPAGSVISSVLAVEARTPSNSFSYTFVQLIARR
jgi:regulation of enolase protein 1 (concanavalin A-like superfamily)